MRTLRIYLYLTGVHLIGLHFHEIHFMGMYLICVHLTGMCLMGVYLIGTPRKYPASLEVGVDRRCSRGLYV
jgi:hypothetical protein